MSVHKKALPNVITREDINYLERLVYLLNWSQVNLAPIQTDGQGYRAACERRDNAKRDVDAAFKALYRKLDQQ